MRFDELPTELVEIVLKTTDFYTMRELARTNARIYRIMKQNHLDKVHATKIGFELASYGKLKRLECNVYYILNGHEYLSPCTEILRNHDYTTKMKLVLSWIKSVDCIKFTRIVFDGNFPEILKECYFEWRNVKVEFINCRYVNMSREELLSVWKISEKVIDFDGKLEGTTANAFDDQVIMQVNSTFILSTSQQNREVFDNINGITDETLEFLARNRKDYLALDGYITNYTADGVITFFEYLDYKSGVKLAGRGTNSRIHPTKVVKTSLDKIITISFQEIVRSRCSKIEVWCIGSIALDLDVYNRLREEFKQFNTEYSTFKQDQNWSKHALLLKVTYRKKKSRSRAIVSVGLVRLVELLFEDENLINDLMEFHQQPAPQEQEEFDFEVPDYGLSEDP